MRPGFHRNDSQVGIVIVSGSCCIPGMAPFDQQASHIVERAISETGVTAEVKVMPATTAYFGGVPKEVMAHLIDAFQRGQMPVPAILVNGKAISYGVPELEDIKSALLQAISAKTIKKEDHADE